MSQPTYLLVAYEAGKLKTNSNALRKPITAGDFDILCNDMFCSIELNNLPCEIIDRRTLYINQVDGHVCIMIIDFKIKE